MFVRVNIFAWFWCFWVLAVEPLVCCGTVLFVRDDVFVCLLASGVGSGAIGATWKRIVVCCLL